jgi:hypothetical protein
MRKCSVGLLLMLVLPALLNSRANALEYIITDAQGVSLSGGILDLGDNPTPKNVLIYLRYTTAEAAIINDTAGSGLTTPGLYSGSYQLDFANSARATVASSSDITRGTGQTLNWSVYSTSLSPTPRASFNQGTGSDPALPVPSVVAPALYNQILLGQVTISPGSAVNPAGTLVTLGVASPGDFISFKKDGDIVFWTDPTALTFTVVPEPSTIAMGLISGISLMATGFYRRRQVKMSKSIV